MAKDPEKQSEPKDQGESEIEGLDQEEVEELTDPERPICPRCGWHNTRLSHTRSMVDSVLRAFSLRAFRCRSCGNRFRAIRRMPRV
jgi:tRNA(Ile2) C34 agmatinyltransferase TiaS